MHAMGELLLKMACAPVGAGTSRDSLSRTIRDRLAHRSCGFPEREFWILSCLLAPVRSQRALRSIRVAATLIL